VLLMAGACAINVLFFRLLSQTRCRQTYRQTDSSSSRRLQLFSSQGLCVALVLTISVQETLQLCSLFFFFFWVPVELLDAACYHVSLINLSLSELFSFCGLFFPMPSFVAICFFSAVC